MALIVICVGALCLALFVGSRIKRARARRELEEHSIEPETLHELLTVNQKLRVFDVRQPLDLLAYSELIPGATRIPPKEVLANPLLIPREEDAVVYCTCPDDKTSREILQRALSLNFSRVKVLRGGLAAWKAKGYPVVPYRDAFRLDTEI
ncbi:MAG TPA: rhodanese-like domain-containing protein [Edaphobacter sp.]|uniref:rhodanese-like domain-containing protein n=1 Tax=Edaphobacter sp. TaxID=1934404 RepID=UPI002B9B2EFE|nr:rhodanese-like domain-containing protein [Edaphobacter sp.]HUZ96139.1 rhodanese-like domain-containing protein [Edaphobacter sp.]